MVLGGSTDNEFVKLAWRRDHKDLAKLPIWQFADTNGSLVDRAWHPFAGRRCAYSLHLHRRSGQRRAARLRRPTSTSAATPADTLRVLDALQTDELCPCNREIGGDVLKAA